MPRAKGAADQPVPRGSVDNDLEINVEQIDMNAVYGEKEQKTSTLLRFINAIIGPEVISALLLAVTILSFTMLPDNDEDLSSAFMRFDAPWKSSGVTISAIVGLKSFEYADAKGMTVLLPLNSLSDGVVSVAEQVVGCLKASLSLGIILLLVMVGGRFFTTLRDVATVEAQERRVAIIRVVQVAASFAAIAVGIFLSSAGLGRFPERIAYALSGNPLNSIMIAGLDASDVSIKISNSYHYSSSDGAVVSLLLPAGSRYLIICIIWLMLGTTLLLTATIFWAPRQKLRELVETAVMSTRIGGENPTAASVRSRRDENEGQDTTEEFQLDIGDVYNGQHAVVEGSFFSRFLNGLIGPEMLSVFLVAIVALSLLVYPTTDNMTWFELDAPVLFFQQLWLHVSFSLTGYQYLNPDLEKVTGPLSDFSPNAVKAAEGVRRGLLASVVLSLIFLVNSLILRVYISMQVASEEEDDITERDDDADKNSFRAVFHRMVIIRYFRMATAAASLVLGIYLSVVGYGTLPQALRYDLRDNPENNVVLNALDLNGLSLIYDTKYTYDEADGPVLHWVGGTNKFLALVILWFLIGAVLLATTTLLWGHDTSSEDNDDKRGKKAYSIDGNSSGNNSGVASPTIEYHNPNFATTA